MEQIISICRLCLRKLTGDELNQAESLSESVCSIIVECTSLQVSMTDGLPDQICNNCQTSLNEFHEFRTMCLTSDSTLKNYQGGANNSQNLIDYLELLNFEKVEEEIVSDKHQSEDENRHSLDLDEFHEETDLPITLVKQQKCVNKKSRLKTEKELRVCYICGKLTHTLTEHLITHRDTRDWKCEKCGKLFSNRVAVRKHQRVHNPNKKSHVCEKCGTAFSTKHTLSRHTRTVHFPTKQFECSICDKRFENAYNLKVHKMKHSGEKPYKCKECCAQFTCKIKFREHNIHEHNVTPTLYNCEKCNLSFIYNFQLLAHQKRPEHQTGGVFECNICKENFVKQKLYDKHMRLNHEKKEVKLPLEVRCNICDKTFKQVRYLRQHDKLHLETGKRFKCHICGKAFLCNAFLKEHMRMHTGERPAKCKVCNNAFINFRSLKKHCKIHDI